MARGVQGALLRGFGARDHTATVISTSPIAPHVIRIWLHSPTLFADSTVEPADWLRFWFPDPDGSDAEFQRAYTIAEGDAATGRFAVEMVLHEPAGPATHWARTVQPGARIAVISLMGSSRFELTTDPDDQPAGYLLAGDSASIPGINAIIGTVAPDVPIELYLEQHSADDPLIPLREHPRLSVHWVPRRDATSLAAAIESRDWSNWYAWATPEAATLKALRVRLRDEFGFPKSEIHAQAYWNAGRAMGIDRRSQDIPTGASPPQPSAEAPPAPARHSAAPGAWRAQAAGRLLRPLRAALIFSGVLAGLITVAELAPFVLLVELARLLLAGAERTRLARVGLAAVALLGISALFSAALTLWLHVVDARFSRQLRTRLLGKLSRLPLGWFTARGSGSIKQLLADDTNSLHYLLTHAIPDAVAAVIAPVAVLVYLFVVDIRVALVLFMPVLIYLMLMSVMMTQSGPKIAQAQRWAERMTRHAGTYLQAQPVIRVFGGTAGSGFRRQLDDYVSFLRNWQRPFIAKKTAMDVVTRPSTFLWLILVTGTALILTGRMDPVNLLPFVLLGTTFGGRLLGIGLGVGGIRGGMLAARRLQSALDDAELTVLQQNPDDGQPVTTAGVVRFDAVRFCYRPGVPVIHDVSFTLQPGSITALVGASGSGKSTLAALLARFYDIDSGSISVDGHDIRCLTADELYRRVGFVLQETQLVHGSVRDNIALAVPSASDEQVRDAAVAAQIHDRILRLPQGYDTVLGDAAALSGGEQQRLTIARAILADTPVLILDEATAFADPESEYLVQQALNTLTAHRTVLVIAHRLHTVTGADQILVLDHGSIVERGNHEQLLAAAGRYRALWDTGRAALATAGQVRR